MPPNWDQISEHLNAIKTEFDKSFKSLNRTRIPSEKTQIKHIKILVDKHNQIVQLISPIYKKLAPSHKNYVVAYFNSIKTKLEVIFRRLNIFIPIPENLNDIVEVRFKQITDNDTDSDSGSDTETENTNTSVAEPLTPHKHETELNNSIHKEDHFNPIQNSSENSEMTPTEFLNLASKLIPDFDSNPNTIQKFLNALNLIETIKENNETIAVSLIKTKVSGKAENAIAQATTIEQIKTILKSTIVYETTQTVAAKLLSVKQKADTNAFIKEVEELTQKLESAYLSDGIPASVTTKYASQTEIKTLTNNGKSPEIKMYMNAGTFSTLSEAITKFVDLRTESQETHTINFIRNNTQLGVTLQELQ